MRGKGFVATVVGAVLGGFILMWPVGYAGMLIDARTDPDDMFAGLMGAIVGGAIGIVVGSGLGTWLALRIKKHPGAGPTGVAVAVSIPASVGLGFYLFDATVTRLLPSYDRYVGPLDQGVTGGAFLFLCVLVAVLSVRLVVLKLAVDRAWP